MEQKQIRSIFSRVGIGVVLLMVVWQAGTVGFAALIRHFLPAFMQSEWYMWALSYVPLYLVAFPVFLLVMRAVPNGSGGPAVPLKPTGGQMAKLFTISYGVGIAVNLIFSVLLAAVMLIMRRAAANPLTSVVTQGNPLINMLFGVLVAPVMEEYIFRWILYKKLVRFGGPAYIFTSAILFGLFHLNAFQIPYAVALGVIFAGVTYYTGAIKYSIVLHVGINLLGIGLLPLAMRQNHILVTALIVIAVYALAGTGLILFIIWLAKHLRGRKITQIFYFEPPSVPLADQKVTWLNAGMILVVMIAVALSVYGFFANS